MTNIGLLFNDVSWYFISYFHSHTIQIDLVPFLLNLIPFSIWVFSIILFSVKILNQYVLNFKYRAKTLTVIIIFSIACIFLFLSAVHYASEIFSLGTVSHIYTFIVQIIVFDFVMLCLIHTESKGLSLFFSGIIVLIAGDFFIVYSVISQTSVLYAYGVLLWFLGLLISMFGVLTIFTKADYDIENWLRRDNTIKSKIVFWCFAMSIVSFLLCFVIAYSFSIISRQEFLGLPLFIMIYSNIVIILFSYLGKYFEIPFRQISANIKALMLDDKKLQSNSNFSVEEFIFLQKFITDAFTYRKEKEQENITLERERAKSELERVQTLVALKEEQIKNEAFRVTAIGQESFRAAIGQMVHDIQSPLSSLSTIVAEQSGNLPENTRITLRNATNRIADIANNMLSKYENKNIVISENTPQLVSLALLHVISEKRYEYSKLNVNFEINIEQRAYFVFIKINPSDFKRMISNIINNAVEALKNKPEGKVEIELCIAQDHAVIFIRDNGYGMPQHIVDKFYKGIAVTEGKEKGHGLGLSQVRETVATYDGKCKIYVTENEGTELVIRFPLVPTPAWIASEIKLTRDDTVIVLDDDESTHGAWKNKFKSILEKSPSLQVKYFMYGREVVEYISGLNDEQKENIFLLTDYELLNQDMNGLDVVKDTGMRRALLVTSHASSPEIQEKVFQSGIKALPKELTHALTITVDKKIPKGSRVVDMVWVEDLREFVDDMVREYYGHIKVDVYYEPISFMEDVRQYPLDTRFILDTNYCTEEGKAYVLDGFAIAKKLHEMGYTKLILFAGEAVKPEKIPPYLTVVLKNDLERRKNLDKI
jgi:signal transduction histidine kinase